MQKSNYELHGVEFWREALVYVLKMLNITKIEPKVHWRISTFTHLRIGALGSMNQGFLACGIDTTQGLPRLIETIDLEYF